MKTTKVTSLALYAKLMQGIAANFPKKTAIEVAGEELTPAQIQTRIQLRIDKAAATEAAKTTYHQAVEDERVAEGDASTLRDALEGVIQGKFGKTSAKLLEFGYAPAKARKVSAATKAQSVEQAQATREKNGTMGKNQRKKAAQAEASEAAQAAAVPAPAAAPGSTSAAGAHTSS